MDGLVSVHPGSGRGGIAHLTLEPGDPAEKHSHAIATGPVAVPVVFDLRCDCTDLPITEVRIVLSHTTFDTNPGATFSGTTISVTSGSSLRGSDAERSPSRR